jgi:hypothetical protein
VPADRFRALKLYYRRQQRSQRENSDFRLAIFDFRFERREIFNRSSLSKPREAAPTGIGRISHFQLLRKKLFWSDLVRITQIYSGMVGIGQKAFSILDLRASAPADLRT